MDDATSEPVFIVTSGSAIEGLVRANHLAFARGEHLLRFTWGLLAISGLMLLATSGPIGFSVGVLALFVGLVGVATGLMPPGDRMRDDWAAYSAHPYTFAFNHDGIDIDSEYESWSIDWPAVAEMREDGRVMVFFRGGLRLTWLDTVSMLPKDRSSLVAYVRERIAEANGYPLNLPRNATNRRRIFR